MKEKYRLTLNEEAREDLKAGSWAVPRWVAFWGLAVGTLAMPFQGSAVAPWPRLPLIDAVSATALVLAHFTAFPEALDP